MQRCVTCYHWLSQLHDDTHRDGRLTHIELYRGRQYEMELQPRENPQLADLTAVADTGVRSWCRIRRWICAKVADVHYLPALVMFTKAHRSILTATGSVMLARP